MEEKDHPYVGVDNIIVNNKGEILLERRSDSMWTFPGYWCLVGGFIDWGETVEEAAKREAREEIGVEIEVVRFLGRYYDSMGRHPKKTVICLPHISRIVSGEPNVNQPEEVSEVRWFKPEEIRKMELAYDHKQMLIDEGLI
ncbi:MAG: NUDIX hydrolase [Candidatus Aenigmarchaeota archaeon]|nr:NUDIX hydrolase [Candidatus Aenigmarchaeota archaeon]